MTLISTCYVTLLYLVTILTHEWSVRTITQQGQEICDPDIRPRPGSQTNLLKRPCENHKVSHEVRPFSPTAVGAMAGCWAQSTC